MSLIQTDLDLVVSSVTESAGRPTNEDAILVATLPDAANPSESGYVLAIADGMGGLERGEVASKLAIDLLADLFARERPSDIALALKQAYRRANDAIYKEIETNPGEGEIGTTLVSAIVHGKYVTIANVGDSRAYLMRANQITQITQDHSVVAEQVSQGRISAQEARTSPQRNVLTHALGTAPQLDRRLPSIYELTLLPEDRLLLCSDGFYDVMQSEDYLRVLGSAASSESARQLSALAQERGTTDNVSAIVVSVSPSLATVQRAQIGTEIASQAGSRFGAIVFPAIVLLIVIVAIAVGAIVYLM
ncbi:MAG TPA: protein phosphatase 2C domain-containing protein [Thermomicrobiales bacterium]|nr:protein phosphatase 2C domain-containing protein [Thermomicrobiales bacterium]